MKYKDAVKQAMEDLAKDPRIRFLGYNVAYGSRAYGTLSDVAKDKCVETPLAENLMVGLAAGMSLKGYRPVVFFERHDFLLNAMDMIVNHISKIEKLSCKEYEMPVIIRAVVGATKPIDPGLQHTQDFTEMLKQTVDFPVIELTSSSQILKEFHNTLHNNKPILFIERKALYNEER